ncbi:hypothetical protein HN385_06625 [archaeon]|jgi:hypothetical protein|nr:hypothetical protein [archaeon]MBT7193758.1 hypothetical protein [archaeon]MBT7381405.1 hypothetical protein [archaeon]MBT7507984.1 hypothetical protein [archaeon]
MVDELTFFDCFKCNYCSNKMEQENASSIWEGELHYVVMSCDCGRDNWVKVDLESFNPGDLFKRMDEVSSTKEKVFEKGR